MLEGLISAQSREHMQGQVTAFGIVSFEDAQQGGIQPADASCRRELVQYPQGSMAHGNVRMVESAIHVALEGRFRDLCHDGEGSELRRCVGRVEHGLPALIGARVVWT